MAKKPKPKTKKPEDPPRPMGRPPAEFKPEYCDQVIEWGRQGKSKAWLAASLGVSRNTMFGWADQHPDFLKALEIAGELSQLWWEDAGQNGMQAPGFNAAIWNRSMAARFPADWRENKETKIVGPDGGPVQVNVQRIDVNNLPSQALDMLERALEIMENGEEPEVIDGEATEEE